MLDFAYKRKHAFNACLSESGFSLLFKGYVKSSVKVRRMFCEFSQFLTDRHYISFHYSSKKMLHLDLYIILMSFSDYIYQVNS